MMKKVLECIYLFILMVSPLIISCLIVSIDKLNDYFGIERVNIFKDIKDTWTSEDWTKIHKFISILLIPVFIIMALTPTWVYYVLAKILKDEESEVKYED